MILKIKTPESAADKSFGYRFGVDGLMSAKDAAEFCGCSIRTLDRLAERGEIRKGGMTKASRQFCRRSIMNHVSSNER